MNYLSIHNNQCVPLDSIPVLPYELFLESNTGLVKSHHFHCVNYYGYQHNGHIALICCIADDLEGNILVSSSLVNPDTVYQTFTGHHMSFHVFERELSENFGIRYSDHPWLKPVRYPANRADNLSEIAGYPFYSSDNNELHEVGVGPVHAGIIEPGHFRFICNGENVMHLEIQLGYQHRGIEELFLKKDKLLQRTILAENIAGDTVAGHTTAFVHLWESLCSFVPPDDLLIERTIAAELERIAIHTGDLSAICTDIAYQLGSAVFGRLRTPLINFFQEWCGNRLAKGLIRAGYTHFPLTESLKHRLRQVLDTYEPEMEEMWERFHTLPSALSRLEKTGIITSEQALAIGAVGMAARNCGIARDIRSSHPYGKYTSLDHQPVTKKHGDVYSRVQIRKAEISQSIAYICSLLDQHSGKDRTVNEPGNTHPKSFSLSLTEGWRGEICHCAITGTDGKLLHYKIKDPSLHNWLALALAVRNNEISDFPVCNKSFNLSYCGNDL